MALTYAQLIAQTHLDILRLDPKAIILGVGVNDGAKCIFGTTKLAAEAFPERVIETPLSETMLTGAIIGMAADGWHPTLVHARADFLYLSAEHLLNTAATFRMIHGRGCPITVRAIIGRGWGNGPMHSKAPLGMFDVEGIALFTPKTEDALVYALTNAVRTGDPTVILEQRHLYEREARRHMSEGTGMEKPIDWSIKHGPAPASRHLEAAYYGEKYEREGAF